MGMPCFLARNISFLILLMIVLAFGTSRGAPLLTKSFNMSVTIKAYASLLWHFDFLIIQLISKLCIIFKRVPGYALVPDGIPVPEPIIVNSISQISRHQYRQVLEYPMNLRRSEE